VLHLLGSAQQYGTIEGSRALRVIVQAAFDNGHRTRSEVIILLFDEGAEPFSILSWLDATEGTTKKAGS
jgi:hypothetical protein